MKLNDLYPSKYLKASDLGDAIVTVEISKVTMEEVGQEKEQRPCIWFKGKTKGFICNKTNANTIAKVLMSQDTDGWLGGRIQIYATEVQFGNEMVMAIRVKLRPPVAKPAPLPTKPRSPALSEAAKAGTPNAEDMSFDEDDIPEDSIPF